VSGVNFDNVSLAGRLVEKDGDVPLEVIGGAKAPAYNSGGRVAEAGFTYSSGLITPGQAARFAAGSEKPGEPKIVRYEWSFGDGTRATGRVVQHVFPDAEGTLQDHSGRFRVLLRTVDASGRSSWAYQPVVVGRSLQAAVMGVSSKPGVRYRYMEGADLSVDAFPANVAATAAISAGVDVAARKRSEQYGMVFEGLVDIPADGGYTFTLQGNDGGRLEVDSTVIATSPKPWPQVCGSVGNAVQAARGSIALAKGKHRIRVAMTHSSGEDGFAVLWQGPGVPLQPMPASALSHEVDSR